jgi:membrane AbrB-like protein
MNDGGEPTSTLKKSSPARRSLRSFAANLVPSVLALLTGALGSIVFVYAHMPLPWFLGSLTACLIASVLNAPIRRPKLLAIPMRAVLGVAVGSAFTPLLFARAGSMLGSLAVLVPFMALIIIVSLVFYERVAGFDRPTAFFSAVPGGLTDMTAMAEDAGANQRAVILVQATRILIIVFSLPLWLQWHDGLAIGTAIASRVRLFEMSLGDMLVLIAMGWGGWWAARRLGIAGAPIVGPMLVSGIIHASGLTAAKVPMEVLTFAQISVGVLLGCQFRGLTMREFTGTMVWGIANTIVLLAITSVVVVLVSRLTGFDPVSVLLAFAPGGQTELNLLAFILGLDVAYVAMHHLARVAIVIIGAQMILKSRSDWRKGK